MKFNVDFLKKLGNTYDEACKPICSKYGLTKTGFDILMFLANNPEYRTASEIVDIRMIKANLVSVNVDKLVKEGYLERIPVMGDRRKTELLITNKASSLVEEGREFQKNMLNKLMKNTTEEQRKVFVQVLEIMNENLNVMEEE